MVKLGKAAAFASSQASLTAATMLVTIALGVAGDVKLVGAVAPVVLVGQSAIGALQQGIGDAVLYYPDLGAESLTRRAQIAAYWSILMAIGSSVTGVALALTFDLGEWFADVAVAVAMSGLMISECLRLGAIAAGRETRAIAAALANGLLFLAALAASYVEHGSATVFLGIAGSASALATAMITGLRPTTAGARILWRKTRHTATSAASESLWGTGGFVVAMQLTGYVAGTAEVGSIRMATQLLSPLVFVAVVVRRVRVSRGRIAGPLPASLYVAIICFGLVLGTSLGLARVLSSALAFMPATGLFVLAAAERSLASIQQVEAGRLLSLGQIREMLRIRRTGAVASVMLQVPAAALLGAPGFLVSGAIVTVARLVSYRRISS
jgi:hypothetical protein